jgi:hypothetical protein
MLQIIVKNKRYCKQSRQSISMEPIFSHIVGTFFSNQELEALRVKMDACFSKNEIN